METLRYYLLGRQFVLMTDHSPLQWMQQNKGKNARVTRWFLSLQPFQFHIQHRAGSRCDSGRNKAIVPQGVERGGGEGYLTDSDQKDLRESSPIGYWEVGGSPPTPKGPSPSLGRNY
ncbi:unnamed protein product [Eretmochelys imbricata]